MKIRKGDLVQVLSGKDRGKQGRIIEADPRKRRVMVENLNLVKKHRKPRPLKEPHGPDADPAGRRDRPGRAAPGFERDGRLPDVQPAHPGRLRVPR
jgi:hypothetical protein